MLVEALDRSARRVARHLRAAAGADGLSDHDIELHETRKAAKRLRYAAEAAVPVLGRRAARLVSAVHAVQDVLGGRQDAVVARPVWREIAVGSASREAFGYGVLYEREAVNIRAAEEALPSAWRDTRRQLTRTVHRR